MYLICGLCLSYPQDISYQSIISTYTHMFIQWKTEKYVDMYVGKYVGQIFDTHVTMCRLLKRPMLPYIHDMCLQPT